MRSIANDVHKGLFPGHGGFTTVEIDQVVQLVERNNEAEVEAALRLEKLSERYGFTHTFNQDFEVSRLPLHKNEFGELEFVFEPFFEFGEKLSHNVFDFVQNVAPLLQEIGLQVEIQDSWPHRVYEGEIKFRTNFDSIAMSNGKLEFTFDLLAKDLSMDIRAVILKMISNLPLKKSGFLESDFDIEKFLENETYCTSFDDGTGLSLVPIEGRKLARYVEPYIECFFSSNSKEQNLGDLLFSRSVGKVEEILGLTSKGYFFDRHNPGS